MLVNHSISTTKAVRAGLVITIAALFLAFSTNLHAQSSPLTVQPSTGRVGVGNTNPTETLDVTGTVKATTFKGDGSQLTNLSAGNGLLNKVSANTTISGTTAETTLYSYSVPGGTLGTNNTLRLTLRGTFFTNDGGNSMTLRIKYGATALSANLGIFNGPGDGSPAPWVVAIELSGDGATNAQLMHAIGTLPHMVPCADCSGTTGWTNNGTSNVRITRGTSAVDSTAAQNLIVTGQWNWTVSSENITLEYAMLEKLS